MARTIARDRDVSWEELLAFVRPRHRMILMTTRIGGRPQASPVTAGLDEEGRILIASYPERIKCRNARRNPSVSVLVLSDEFNGEWVQVDGRATVTNLPEALDGLVEYFRIVGGEHPDWAEYRQAMIDQGKCLLTVTIDRWSPISRGGFPARLVD